jgi:hypothetical protein
MVTVPPPQPLDDRRAVGELPPSKRRDGRGVRTVLIIMHPSKATAEKHKRRPEKRRENNSRIELGREGGSTSQEQQHQRRSCPSPSVEFSTIALFEFTLFGRERKAHT